MIPSTYGFGKGYTMVANKIRFTVLSILLSFFISFPTIADSTDFSDLIANSTNPADFANLINNNSSENNGVMEYLTNRLMTSMVYYGEKIKMCQEQTERTPTPVLDKKVIKSNNISRDDIILAIGFFNIKNEALCHENKNINMSYKLMALIVINKKHGINTENLEAVNEGLFFPSEDALNIEARYSKLPDKLKRIFKKTFSGKPFDLIKAFDLNAPEPP